MELRIASWWKMRMCGCIFNWHLVIIVILIMLSIQHALYEEGWWRKLLQITVIRCVLIDPGGDIGDISEIGNCYYPLFADIDIRDVEIVSDCLIDWHKAAKTVQIWDCVTLSIKYCDGGDVTNGTSVTMHCNVMHAGGGELQIHI